LTAEPANSLKVIAKVNKKNLARPGVSLG
jgi:hypothetical protein